MPFTNTFHGFIANTTDTLLIIEACRNGLLPTINRRLVERERSAIKSGTIIVFDESESGIKRWTDGFLWSPSRILGNFLVYRELANRENRKIEDDYSLSHNTHNPTARAEGGSERTLDISQQNERALVGSLTWSNASYNFKDNGLVKKTIRIMVNGNNLHIVNYYNINDVLSRKLPTPSSSDQLTCLQISPDLMPYLQGFPSSASGSNHHFNLTTNNTAITNHHHRITPPPPHVADIEPRKRSRSSEQLTDQKAYRRRIHSYDNSSRPTITHPHHYSQTTDIAYPHSMSSMLQQHPSLTASPQQVSFNNNMYYNNGGRPSILDSSSEEQQHISSYYNNNNRITPFTELPPPLFHHNNSHPQQRGYTNMKQTEQRNRLMTTGSSSSSVNDLSSSPSLSPIPSPPTSRPSLVAYSTGSIKEEPSPYQTPTTNPAYYHNVVIDNNHNRPPHFSTANSHTDYHYRTPHPNSRPY